MGSNYDTETIFKNINSHFDNLSYIEQYNTDIWLTIILIVLAITIFLYFFITNKLQSFKRDWPKYKCNPFFMLFAGIINQPINQSAFEYTSKNFTQCMDEKNQELGLQIQKPINDAMKSLFDVFDFGGEMVQEIQNFILFIFNLLIQLYNFIMQKFSKIINEINLIFISIVNLFGNFLAFFTSLYYMLMIFLSNLKLFFVAATMGFLLSIVLSSLVAMLIVWGIYSLFVMLWLFVMAILIAFSYNLFVVAILTPVAATLKKISLVFLILAIIFTIYYIILIIIYNILSKFVEDVLKHSTPPIPQS